MASCARPFLYTFNGLVADIHVGKLDRTLLCSGAPHKTTTIQT
jgi:hypothetical protein